MAVSSRWIFAIALFPSLFGGPSVLASEDLLQSAARADVVPRGVAATPAAVLFEQAADSTSGSAAQSFPDFGGALLIRSDDFLVPEPGWNIQSLHFTFTWSPSNANPAPDSSQFTGNVVYAICEDDGGQPACLANPAGNSLVNALWSLSLPPTHSALSWVEGGGTYEVTADVAAATGLPEGVSLGAGSYWFVAYLEHDFGTAGIGGQIFWTRSTQEKGAVESLFMDPTNLLPSQPCPSWCDSTPDTNDTHMAFRIEGSLATSAVLIQQEADTSSGSAAQAFPDFGGAMMLRADDFVITSGGWNIQSIHHSFFWSPSNANPAPDWSQFTGDIVYAICADDGGQPACLANASGNALVDPLWTLSVPPTDPAMALLKAGGNYEVTANLVALTGNPDGVPLPMGSYWLVIYLIHDFGAADIGGQIFWSQSSQESGALESMFMDPTDLIPSLPCPTWCDDNPESTTNMAFTLSGFRTGPIFADSFGP